MFRGGCHCGASGGFGKQQGKQHVTSIISSPYVNHSCGMLSPTTHVPHPHYQLPLPEHIEQCEILCLIGLP